MDIVYLLESKTSTRAVTGDTSPNRLSGIYPQG